MDFTPHLVDLSSMVIGWICLHRKNFPDCFEFTYVHTACLVHFIPRVLSDVL
jgi:hypothetical protein